jgi:FkbM family methyltransferase
MAAIGARGRMWAELHYTASSNVVYANPPNWNEMQAWRRILKQGDLFVDVGSNVGSYAIWTADLGAEVVAIEPDHESARRLRENVALNDFPIQVQECALAGQPGRMRLTSGLDTVNHLLVDASTTGQDVDVQTLDDLLGNRTAIGVKIDVEGAERLVLDGAARALADHRIDVLQLEWNEMSQLVLSEDRAPVAHILHSHGYSFYRPDLQGVLQPADVTDYGPDVFAVSPTHVL